MARSDVEHYRLLNRWAALMHEDVWRYNQIGGTGVRLVEGCASPTYIQYERDYIANALNEAVLKSAPYFGFYPSPVWLTEDIPLRPGAQWDNQYLETTWGYLAEFGRRAVTSVAANASVVYSDADSDGVEETASVTVTTAVADDELQAFFRVADGAAGAAHEFWRIEPLSVTDIGGGQKRLRGHKSLFAHPLNVWAREYVEPNYNTKFQGDTSDTDSFVTQVDVYRVYNDPASAVTLYSDPRLAGSPTQVVTGWVQDSRQGYFTLRKTNGGDPDPVQPNFARVFYRAGYPMVGGLTERRLEIALARYANVLMPQDTVFCARTQALWASDRDDSANLTQAEARNPSPFGFSEAGIHLWRLRQSLYLRDKAREADQPEGEAA